MVPHGFTRGIAHLPTRWEDVVRFYGPAQYENIRGLHLWLFLIQQSVRLNQTLKIERNNKIGNERIREGFTWKIQMKRYILTVS